MTNGDKVRAMTDEELAHWFENSVGCSEDWCVAFRKDCGFRCRRAWLDWLKEEAKE